jgi:hypothetical protein
MCYWLFLPLTCRSYGLYVDGAILKTVSADRTCEYAICNNSDRKICCVMSCTAKLRGWIDFCPLRWKQLC